jgi:hypothetical protein
MARKHVLPTALIALALAGCGGGQSSSDVGGPPAPEQGGVSLTVQDDGTTLLTAGEHSQVLSGRFEHARVGPGFPDDGRSITGSRVVLQDTANRTDDRVSRFAVIDTSLAAPAQIVALPGDYDYDAVSPTVDTLYLVSHFSAERPDQYAVRSYDVAADKLDEGVIADKTATTEGPMAGRPVARATTTSGEWVYTAYRGEHAFVHALNTVEKFAVCIDLPEQAAKVTDWKLGLDETARTLEATSPSTGVRVEVDTERFSAQLV